MMLKCQSALFMCISCYFLVAAWGTVSLITGRASGLAVICPGAISTPSKLVWCRGSVDPGSTAISAVARVLKIDHDDSSVELSDVITTMLLFLVFPTSGYLL